MPAISPVRIRCEECGQVGGHLFSCARVPPVAAEPLGNWLAGFLDRFPVVCNLVVLCGIFGVWLDSFLHASRFHIGFFYFYSSRGRMEGIEPVTWMPGSPFDATLWSVPYWVIAAPFAILFCYHLVVHQRERKRGAEAGKNNGPI